MLKVLVISQFLMFLVCSIGLSSQCPLLAGSYQKDGGGPILTVKQKLENGVIVYDFFDDFRIITDGKTHRRQYSTYSATCNEGTLNYIDNLYDGSILVQYRKDARGFQETSERVTKYYVKLWF